MSIFTNHITAAAEEADAYIEAVLELLGERDALAVLRELPDALDERVAGLSAAAVSAPEAPGKWSINEVIQHFADSELVWAYRLRQVVADSGATITGYDQDRWAERLRYSEADPADALALIRVLRAANLRLLESLNADELQRVGVHSERGEESIAHMVRLYAGHDLVHLLQIDRIRSRIE